MESVESRRTLVALRRELATILGTMEEGAAHDLQDSEVISEFRRRFAVVRSRITLRQAKWPAVILDHSLPEFRSEAREVHEIIDAFLTWINPYLRACHAPPLAGAPHGAAHSLLT